MTLDGEIAHGAGPISCGLTVDGLPTVIELASPSWERSFPLRSHSAVESAIYVDLSCTVSANGGDGLEHFERVGIRVD